MYYWDKLFQSQPDLATLLNVPRVCLLPVPWSERERQLLVEWNNKSEPTAVFEIREGSRVKNPIQLAGETHIYWPLITLCWHPPFESYQQHCHPHQELFVTDCHATSPIQGLSRALGTRLPDLIDLFLSKTICSHFIDIIGFNWQQYPHNNHQPSPHGLSNRAARETRDTRLHIYKPKMCSTLDAEMTKGFIP